MPDNPFPADEFATMSVWRSLEDLRRFTFGGEHLAISAAALRGPFVSLEPTWLCGGSQRDSVPRLPRH